MSYHIFNDLAELINGYLTAEISWVILSIELVYRECNFSLSYKVNVECVYRGKFRIICLIYEVKFLMCETIYIGNTQQTFKKRMGGHFSNLLRLLNNGQI